MAKAKARIDEHEDMDHTPETPIPDEGITQWMKEAETEPQMGDPNRNEQYLAKGGIVGDSKDEYEPDVPHMDEGGMVGGFDAPDQGDTDTVKGLPLNPSAVPQMPILTPEPAQVAAPVALAPKAQSNPNPLPGIPPEGTQDALNSFLSQQKAGLEKYGPEQQLAVQNDLIKQRQGLGNRIATGLAGFGDDLIRAGGGGDAGHQQRMMDQQNQLAQEKMGTMEKAQTGKMAQMKAEMELSQNDPTSPLSKIAQNSERPLLQKLGWNDTQIGKVSATMIQDAVKNNLTYEDVQAKYGLEKEIHEETVGLQRQALGQKGSQFNAEHPILSRIAGLNNNPANPNTTLHGVPDLGSTFNGQKVIGVKRVK